MIVKTVVWTELRNLEQFVKLKLLYVDKAE